MYDFTIHDVVDHYHGTLSYKVVKSVLAVVKRQPRALYGSEPDDYMRDLYNSGYFLNDPRGTRSGLAKRLGTGSDAVGHIIGAQFGGDANRRSGNGNVFPQDPGVNSGKMAQFETKLGNRSLDERVCVRIVFSFGNPSLQYRPVKLVYDSWIDGVQQPQRDFPNPT